MTTSPRDQTPAEYRATVEAEARARLDEGKQALESLKARELAEAEALNLTRIRIQTDQMLAKQAEALRDADQKAQLAAIDRRSADLEAVKEARRRLELEETASQANAAKKEALLAAAAAAREKQAALVALENARSARRERLKELKQAARTEQSLRWQVRWQTLQLLPVWLVFPLALVTGALAALVFVKGAALVSGGEDEVIHLSLPAAATSEAAAPIYADPGRGPGVTLRLDGTLAAAP